MAETILEARLLLNSGCHVCCGEVTRVSKGELICSCGPEIGIHPFPAPPQACPLPRADEQLVKGTLKPEEVTPEWVEAQRPKRDEKGNWIPRKLASLPKQEGQSESNTDQRDTKPTE